MTNTPVRIAAAQPAINPWSIRLPFCAPSMGGALPDTAFQKSVYLTLPLQLREPKNSSHRLFKE